MSPGSDPVGAGTAVGAADPRVTRVGRILRRTSLDEVPNLVNVLRGDMALVGPRPTIPSHLVYLRPHQHRRHAVRPGITGWAQVNGRVGITWGERIELDNWYVENRSVGLDLRILARTLAQVTTGRGLDPG
jgi:lipopolysaccharide/colanic/teichoic acid biosynthesis glycosyltransferase